VRIALDATYALGAEPTGIAVYSRRLIRELTALRPDDHFQLCYRSNRWLRGLREPLPAPNTSRASLWQGRRAAVFHGLNQRLPNGSIRCAVTTFHDLFVMTGEYSTPEFRVKFTDLARDAAARSDRVIAISEFTAGQVAGLLDFPRDRIHVVPHGVDPADPISPEKVADYVRKQGWQGRCVFLHVGAVQTRKNVGRLVKAFEQLSGEPLLALAGGAGFGAEAIEQRIAASPARERIITLGYVDGPTKALLYHATTALAFPSLDEGFGLPVIEAMAAGLPVLTSHGSALQEVAGDAALLVDPLDSDAIRYGLQQLSSDPALRTQLAARGRLRATQFTWRRAAELTWDAYIDALS
jgi:glycosyltransferase involved in cell wall biosynthesis